MGNAIQTSLLAPEIASIASALGTRIRVARHRRRLRVEDVAEKAQLSKKTVEAVERGALTTSLGAYLAVLGCLNLAKEVELVADPALDREGADLLYSPAERRVRPSRKVDNDF
jgi:transcriptional regulator with XRE-family HTH domain